MWKGAEQEGLARSLISRSVSQSVAEEAKAWPWPSCAHADPWLRADVCVCSWACVRVAAAAMMTAMQM